MTAAGGMSLAAAVLARLDPGEFVRQCLSDPSGRRLRWGRVHDELHEFLSYHTHALVALPRDHGKSTQVCGRLLWELGRSPELRIKVVCASAGVAAERSRFLRELLVAGVGREVFPQLRPSRPWTANAWTIVRPAAAIGPSVAAFGVGAARTGTRADLIVGDDLVDVRALRSAKLRQWVCTYFQDNLINLLEPDGRCWLLYTPWHRDDLHARLQQNTLYRLLRRAVTHALDPVWPQQWDRARLQRRRIEIGATAFARGYRLQPLAESDTLIRPEWVKVWEASRPAEMVVAAVDPAVGTEPRADRSAIVVVGRIAVSSECEPWSEGVQLHVLAAVARRVPAPELLHLLAAIDEQWRPAVILFEANAAFAGLRDWLVRHAHFGPKVKSVVQTKDKAARFAAFSVAVENGTFRLRGDGRGHVDPSQHELYEEMVQFPGGEHDDLLDAAATACAWLLEQRPPRVW